MPSVIATLKQRRASLALAARNTLPAIRYATRLIRKAPGRFDAVEIHGVRQFPDPADPTQSFCEVDDDNPSFFSVYLHCIEGGVTCCADLPTHRRALRYARAVARRYRWPLYNYSPTQARLDQQRDQAGRKKTSR
ncbi:conserved hypothetical protein [Burkholderia diffusa]|uniref:hypothetical protein n=1 Tax=Burkholderia diffusa TaxID=488732 RepID=UPI001CAE6F83|nr:hypothetical protein [Burkholderia diffusa]CAG9257994.1 conserved hypothetical protein [Burkholderia diffusa]